LRDLERHASSGTLGQADVVERAATWRTAVYQLFAVNAAAYDFLILMRRQSPYGHHIYNDIFRHRAGERDSPVVAR